ncbi:MAG: Alanine dehydrogenase [Acidobacteria bacterium]|nr:Alanine dehydrogenase [Acidobacteriota bacterium]
MIFLFPRSARRVNIDVAMHEIDATIAACRRILDAGERGLLVTIVGTRGSTYRRAGARLVISERGEAAGVISGGCVERDLGLRFAELFGNGEPRLITYDSSSESDIVFGTGLGCRGAIDMYVEPFDAAQPPRLVRELRWNGREAVPWTTELAGRELLVESIRPQRTLAVFGGGPDAPPVAKLAESIGWQATLAAPRDLHPDDVAKRLDLASFDAAVIMTHNYLFDLTLLGALLPSPIPYVGLLGPRSRGDELVAQVDGITPAMRARLHNPIGLDLGGESPDEIALSIVAEIQAVLNARGEVVHLKDRDTPIHAAAGERVPCA